MSISHLESGLPDCWRIAELREVFESPPRNGYSPQESDEENGTYMLGLGCLTREGFRPRQLKNAPKNDQRLGAAILRDGDLLMSRSNTSQLVGLSGIYRDIGSPCIYPDLMMRLTPTADTGAAYLDYVLRWSGLRRQIEAAAVGTSGSMVKLSAKAVGRLRMPLPPRPQQRAIAHVLSTLDDLIADTEAAIAKLEAIRQGLLHDLLTRGLDENGELRSRRESPVTRAVPDGWRTYELRDLLSEPPRNGIYMPPSAIGSGTLMVGQTSFDATNRVDFRIGRRAQVLLSERRVFGLAEGDVMLVRVFATAEGVGRPVFVEAPPEPTVFESNMMRIRVLTEKIKPYYLWLWMSLPRSRRHFTSRANASTQASINRSVVDTLPCWVPPLPEQARIMAVVLEQDEQQRCDNNKLSKLKNLRAGVSDALLSGRTRVTPDLLGLPPEDHDV